MSGEVSVSGWHGGLFVMVFRTSSVRTSQSVLRLCGVCSASSCALCHECVMASAGKGAMYQQECGSGTAIGPA